jgi:hypothetical protein
MDLYFSPLACSMATRISLYEAGADANYLEVDPKTKVVVSDYLVTVINWTMATPPVELAKWPTVKAYYERMRARPSVAKAIAEEFELYKAELARHKAAA